MKKILIDENAIRQVLDALLGPVRHIHDLQVRFSVNPDRNDPISIMLKDFLKENPEYTHRG